jgi:hypothetical protein
MKNKLKIIKNIQPDIIGIVLLTIMKKISKIEINVSE